MRRRIAKPLAQATQRRHRKNRHQHLLLTKLIGQLTDQRHGKQSAQIKHRAHDAKHGGGRLLVAVVNVVNIDIKSHLHDEQDAAKHANDGQNHQNKRAAP